MFAYFKALCLIAVTFLAQAALAEEIVLTVSGAVEPADGRDALYFEMKDLRDLPTTQIETTTVWTQGVQTFEGVSLATLLEHVGAPGASVEALALNDYMVEIPGKDAVPGGALIAYSRNGSEMAVRDKGPLWIVYPFDGNEKFKTEEYFSRSIWQLDRLVVLSGD